MFSIHKNKIQRLILLVLVALMPLSPIVFAQTNENEELKVKIIKLEQKIQELESIECKIPSNPKKGKGNAWNSLQVNMSKADVKSILGKPGKIDKWKTGEAWYYPDPRGGEVDFDSNGNVTGWLEP